MERVPMVALVWAQTGRGSFDRMRDRTLTALRELGRTSRPTTMPPQEPYDYHRDLVIISVETRKRDIPRLKDELTKLSEDAMLLPYMEYKAFIVEHQKWEDVLDRYKSKDAEPEKLQKDQKVSKNFTIKNYDWGSRRTNCLTHSDASTKSTQQSAAATSASEPAVVAAAVAVAAVTSASEPPPVTEALAQMPSSASEPPPITEALAQMPSSASEPPPVTEVSTQTPEVSTQTPEVPPPVTEALPPVTEALPPVTEVSTQTPEVPPPVTEAPPPVTEVPLLASPHAPLPATPTLPHPSPLLPSLPQSSPPPVTDDQIRSIITLLQVQLAERDSSPIPPGLMSGSERGSLSDTSSSVPDKPKKLCRDYHSPWGCRYGNSCWFSHGSYQQPSGFYQQSSGQGVFYQQSSPSYQQISGQGELYQQSSPSYQQISGQGELYQQSSPSYQQPQMRRNEPYQP